MTRQEFVDEVCSWSDLIDFCSDNRLDFTDDIYDEGGRDDYVNEGLVDMARENTWDELWSILDRIPTGYEYYRYDYGDWDGLTDDDFYDLKQEVEEYCARNGYFDDEEEEEPEETEDEPEEEDEEPEEEEEPIEDEDFSLGEFFSSGVDMIEDLKEAERIEREEEEKQYREVLEDFSVLFGA